MSAVLEAKVIEFGSLKAKIEIPDDLRVVGDEPVPEGCGMFRIMTAKDGDKRVVWNSTSLTEISAARRMFMDCVREGLVPYRVGTDGKATTKIMDEFDPAAEEVIFLPVRLVRGG
jgi:hypothetical protein